MCNFPKSPSPARPKRASTLRPCALAATLALGLTLPPFADAAAKPSAESVPRKSAKPAERIADLRVQLLAAEEAEAWPSVAEIARRILAVTPRDPDLREKRARALAQARDWIRCGEALDEWEKSAPPRRAIIAGLRGDIASANEDDAAAIREWSECVRLAPKDVATMDKLAQTLARTGDWDDAARVLEKRAKIAPTADSIARLATCRAELRDWKTAFAEIRRASGIDATDDRVRSALPALERLETQFSLIQRLERAAAAAPREAAPRLDFALLFARAEWPHLALADAEQALRIAPDSRAGLLLKGVALVALGKSEEAEKLGLNVAVKLPHSADINRLAELDAELRTGPPTAALFAKRSMLLSQLRHFTLALQDADSAIKLDAASDDSHLARGIALAGREGPLDGLPELVKATELNPKNRTAWMRRGNAEDSLTDYRAAIVSFTQLVALDEKDIVALTQRERAFRALGKNIEAAEDAVRIRNLKK